MARRRRITPSRDRTIDNLSVVIDELTEYVADINARVARNLIRDLRDSTPVDTGHAASNWIGNIGAPYGGVAGSKSSVDFGPQNRSLISLAAQNKTLRNVFITNNVEYIGILNTGWSKKAPSGFIQRAISRARAT